MQDDQYHLLALVKRPPARVTAPEVAWMINAKPHDIPNLIARKLLKPLGNPPVNGVKFFAVDEIMELSMNRAWLAKVTNAIYEYWLNKNQKKTKNRLLVVAKNNNGDPAAAKPNRAASG